MIDIKLYFLELDFLNQRLQLSSRVNLERTTPSALGLIKIFTFLQYIYCRIPFFHKHFDTGTMFEILLYVNALCITQLEDSQSWIMYVSHLVLFDLLKHFNHLFHFGSLGRRAISAE